MEAPPHARSASTGTSSECTPAGSSSPQSNVDVYDVKFQGMDAVCIDHSHPQENGKYSVCMCSTISMNSACMQTYTVDACMNRSHFKALHWEQKLLLSLHA